MKKVEQIESEIKSLSPEELAELRNWFRAFDASAWDAEIQNDIHDGKLDSLAQTALDAHRRQSTREL